jgi:hypothetical protein
MRQIMAAADDMESSRHTECGVLRSYRCWARLRSRFVFHLGCLDWTLKASRIIAQGKRSGDKPRSATLGAGLKYVGYNPVRVARGPLWNPFRVQRVYQPPPGVAAAAAATPGYVIEPPCGSCTHRYRSKQGRSTPGRP